MSTDNNFEKCFCCEKYKFLGTYEDEIQGEIHVCFECYESGKLLELLNKLKENCIKIRFYVKREKYG